MKGFLVGGTASGVGKTTVSLSILAALRRRGVQVQPFKGGPDFLDTGHLTRIAGRTARNVDTWMLSHETNRELVRRASQDADAILVEGMMGLFDGKAGDSEVGSSAEIAKLLGLPVVLVLDASKSARSLAAVVLGFESFDPELSLAGVVLNRVASERHFALLQSAIRYACRSPILGWLPRDPSIGIPERHLGLRTVEESAAGAEAQAQQLDAFADLAEKHLDLACLSALTCGLENAGVAVPPLTSGTPVRIGVARDEAFSFYYEDNLDFLREHGAEVVPFSPLRDSELPPDLDALYLGGGYPELYARQLSANGAMRTACREFARSGKPVYGECGGMLYLGEELAAGDGTRYPMAGLLPLRMEMTGKLVQFGYVTVTLRRDCLLGPAGSTVRGHSFHYSRLTHMGEVETSYEVQYSLSGRQEREGFTLGNVLASYIHLHFHAAPALAAHFVEAARRKQSAQKVFA